VAYFKLSISLISLYNQVLIFLVKVMTPVYCLMGPTAVGKTALAAALARDMDMEIISVDSALIYRGMDIGTAKPTKAERCGVEHHLIDIINPDQVYSAGDFCQDVAKLIDGIIARGRRPLLVGGTMMYFHALQHGIAALPEADAAVRSELLEQAERQGWEALHRCLAQCDPDAAAAIHINDKQRILRALEVWRLSGERISVLQRARHVGDYQFINMALLPRDRSLLHDRIEQRVHGMLAQGFDAEVRGLLSRSDYHSELPAMKTVGYRQWARYLTGQCSEPEAIFAMIVATRQLAKRQMTWLRRWHGVNTLWMEDKDGLARACRVVEACVSDQ
jgi:tRNA dimethylallyltransferase